ncbi:hypothetical protein [Burkholderia glumae]|uniref:hypothetical protein n=1 Tax=Burkholderia glumae TaxID=337 RepID=UPI0002FF4F46|nr:hypothetical protein [Burkholderia glumae]PJO23031.1 hypothetical protein Y5A_011565 [Burkholderia glumae AU6208]QHE11124.1 hypothetical protein GQR88_12370 [Burkholderia glumae AU6208]QJP72581.1 hypothetical protein HJC54_20950 [Burkholderia glumae]
MIGANARESFERIFFGAAQARLATDGVCEITPREAPDVSRGIEAIVLTISSLRFRLLLLLHYRDDPATRAYYIGTGGTAGQRPLREAFLEVANLCCGAINQALVEHFPDLGMSTPYGLNGASAAHLVELRPDHVSAYDLMVGGTVRLGATLCVCANAPVEFVAQTLDVDAGAGELELF